MVNCLEPGCIGWHLLPSDQFCSWCGAQLAELTVSFEEKVDEEWRELDPPLLTRDHRPALQVRITHTGHSGSVLVDPDRVRCTASWMGLDTSGLKAAPLAPGDSVVVPVNRLKVPGKEDSFQEARIEVSTPTLQTSGTVSFVPHPAFELELASQEILLVTDQPAVIDASLRLITGRAILTSPPGFKGRWVDLALDERLEFPLELDARSRSRLPLRLRVRDDTAGQLRQSALGRKEESLKRGGVLELEGVLPGSQAIRLPIEVSFLLGPELVVEPFRERSRMDWKRIEGLDDDTTFEVVVSNGSPGTQGRTDLVVRHLDLLEAAGWLTCDESAFPLTLASGESATLALRAHRERMPGLEATARLAFVTNDTGARDYYLRVQTIQPGAFPGWLAVDFGTSNTCAALVDANQAVTMLDLEDVSLDGEATTLPSVICYLELVARRHYEVGTWAWERATHPAASRSVVTAAKRYLGSLEHHFEVVPVDEPAATVHLAPREAVTDLLVKVVDRAQAVLRRQGRSDLLLTRSLICHPSRFSVHQIEELKSSIAEGVRRQHRQAGLGSVDVTEPHTLHEPIGAALHFLNRWESHAPQHERTGQDRCRYSLLVYDFGGGTLDITLIGVTSERRLLAGATDPARELRELVAARCRTLLRRDEGETAVIPAELQEANSYLLDQFVGSLRGALREGVTRADLVVDPQVDDKLMVSYALGETVAERAFRRDELVPDDAELARLAGGHPYSYTVDPQVLGATGHRWLGGEDVTAITRDLLIASLVAAAREVEDGESIELPLGEDPADAARSLAGRRNLSVLRNWSEELKILLSEGASQEALRARYQSLFFWIDGEERLVLGTALWKAGGAPTLEQIQAAVRPRLEESVGTIRELLGRHGLKEPDVVLRVGKASKLPLVDEVLKTAFPHAAYHAPERAKRCVVEGAATFPIPGRVGGGIQLSRDLRRAGVRVRLGPSQALSATTSRLGVKVVEGGQAWFHELIGVGVPVPPEGLNATLEGVVLRPGHNVIPILENAGHQEEVLLEGGRPNPDVTTVRQLELEVPEEADPFALEEAVLKFHLTPDLELFIVVEVKGLEPFTFDPLPSAALGSTY